MNVPEHAERHRRGVVRVPWDTGDTVAGAYVDAYVCCDPRCGGVELSPAVLDINHGCCDLARFKGQREFRRGEHRVGLGRRNFTGYYRGPWTALWRPAPPGAVEQPALFAVSEQPRKKRTPRGVRLDGPTRGDHSDAAR